MDTSMKISDGRTITEKQAYEAMLHFLAAWLKLSGSKDLTDILSGGEYWEEAVPADPAFWEYWQEAVEKVLSGEPPLIKRLTK